MMAGRDGLSGSDRFAYLQGLVTEFQDADSEDLRTLQVTELFLDMLTEENQNLVEFGIGGLCNLSMDQESRNQIVQTDGVPLVMGCLSSPRDETVLSAITTLMNLTTATSHSQTTNGSVVLCMLRFSLSENPRLRNLASVFLQDYCTEEQVEKAREHMQGHIQSAVGIPLPDNKPFLDSSQP
ncbi:armadillo repeat-containing protein 7 isoform X2 [Chanos chanos]|uniref:Armadillo repeat-containing protein 7 isoform X2 n=1 Tax=Chanos chanos TaxID=29144 RepID=A0A6J2VDR4_CHACN|nr:armadillo repeat-containing protein 7 isoform X2 [Chanos chanos]